MLAPEASRPLHTVHRTSHAHGQAHPARVSAEDWISSGLQHTGLVASGQGGSIHRTGADGIATPWWFIVLVLIIVTIAAVSALRLIGAALGQLLRIGRRRLPSRLRWALHPASLPSPRVGMIVLLSAVAGAASFLVTRWVQARVTEPQSFLQSSQRSNSTSSRANFVKTTISHLRRQGLSHEQAILFTAHLARETGWGKFVVRNNFGNIKVGSWTGESFWLTDRRGYRCLYRAYATPEDGLRDNLTLIQDSARYRRSWALLQAGDASWYGQLGLDGYYEGPPDWEKPGIHTVHNTRTVAPVQREYSTIVALVRRLSDA